MNKSPPPICTAPPPLDQLFPGYSNIIEYQICKVHFVYKNVNIAGLSSWDVTSSTAALPQTSCWMPVCS